MPVVKHGDFLVAQSMSVTQYAAEIAPDAAAVQMRQFAKAQMAQFVQSGADAAVQIELEAQMAQFVQQYASQSDGVIGEPSPLHPEAKQKNAEAAQIERCAALELGLQSALEKHTAKLIEERQAIQAFLEHKEFPGLSRVSYSLRFKELEEEIAGNEKILFQSLESV